MYSVQSVTWLLRNLSDVGRGGSSTVTRASTWGGTLVRLMQRVNMPGKRLRKNLACARCAVRLLCEAPHVTRISAAGLAGMHFCANLQMHSLNGSCASGARSVAGLILSERNLKHKRFYTLQNVKPSLQLLYHVIK